MTSQSVTSQYSIKIGTLCSILSIFFVLLYSGCTLNSNVSGAEIGNPNIAIMVTDADSSAVIGAKVSLFTHEDSLPSEVIYSDSLGRVFFQQSLDSAIAIECVSSDSTLIAWVRKSNAPFDSIITITFPGTIMGLVNNDALISTVHLRGTPYIAPVSDEGEYSTYQLSLVPEGEYLLIGRTSTQETLELGKVKINSGQSLHLDFNTPKFSSESSSSSITFSSEQAIESSSEELSQTPSKQILVEDFEDGDAFNLLQQYFGWGNWVPFTDSTDGGISTISPAENYPYLWAEAIQETGGPDSSRSILMEVSLNPTIANPYAGLAMNIGNSSLDLRDLEALSFFVKGDGALTISVERDLYPNGVYSSTHRASWKTTPTLEWSKISLPISTLQLDSPSPEETIDALLQSTYRIRFTATSGTWFEFDSISFEGIDLSTISQ